MVTYTIIIFDIQVLEVLQDYFGMNHLDIGNPVNRTWSYNLNNGVMFMSFSISFNLQTMHFPVEIF